MDLKQLQYFYVVARHENFSASARELYVAQPALSKAIQRLEAELECRLFIRTGRSIKLSPAGAMLKERLGAVLPAIESLPAMLRDFEENYTKSVRVSVRAAAAGCFDAIAEFARADPRLSIHISDSADFADCDLLFTHDAPDPEQTGFLLLAERELRLLVRQDSPFAERDSVPPGELAQTPYILNNTAHTVRRCAEQALEQAGVQLRPRLTVAGGDQLWEAVQNGLGVAMTPQPPQALLRGGLAAVPLEGCDIKCPLYLSWSKGNYLSRAARRLILFLCDYYHLPPPGREELL